MFKSISSLLKNYETASEYRSRRASFSRNKPLNNNPDCFDFIALIDKWPDIIGTKMASHSVPLRNTHYTLTILTSHSVFASQLSFMEETIKKRIFALFPNLRSSIKRIKFQAGSQHFEQQKNLITSRSKSGPPAKQEKKDLHPYSVEYRELLEHAQSLFQGLEDPELKQTLTSLLIQNRK